MMHMTFYWGRQVTVLFDGWKTQSWLGYSLTLVAVFLFSVFHEYIVNLRSRFKGISSGKAASGLTAPLIGRNRIALGFRVMESAVFGLNAGLGYLLMLAAMSFNGGVFIAVILGFVVGYFFFRSHGEVEEEITESPCGCS